MAYSGRGRQAHQRIFSTQISFDASSENSVYFFAMGRLFSVFATRFAKTRSFFFQSTAGCLDLIHSADRSRILWSTLPIPLVAPMAC